MKKTTALFTLGAALMLSACSGTKGWSIDGTIADAPANCRIALEANNAGHWYVLDSIDVAAGSGKFAYKSDAPSERPEIYRLSLPGKGYVYFPIDSVDHVTLTANAATFGHKHSLAGSTAAATVSRIDSIAASGADAVQVARQLANIITQDTTGYIAYYAVGKSIDGKAVFNPKESFGNRVYGAAAQVFASYQPLDRRGEALRAVYYEGRRAMGRLPEPEQKVIEVDATGLFDIVRYDNRGARHSLSEIAASGKPVLLSFTAYNLESSPAYNTILNDIYKSYHDKGLEIYQIAFDADEVTWKEAAKNLPWVTVWNSPSDGNNVLMQYNVGALPMTYIIKGGDLGKRVVNPAELSAEVAKLF